MKRSSARTWAAERRSGLGWPEYVERIIPGAPAVPETELRVATTAVRRGTRRDAILASLAVAGLGLTILKPWAAPADAPLPAPEHSVSVFASPTPATYARLSVSAVAFDPPAEACMGNAGWRVCVLGSSGGRAVRSMFGPEGLPALGPGAPKTRAAPAVLLLTTAGAGLGFYPPLDSDDLFAGTIAVTAWSVGGEAVGTRSLSLRAMGPLRLGAKVAGNVHLPASDALMAAERWPSGRYIVRFQAANGDHWDQFFALEVIAIPAPDRTHYGGAVATTPPGGSGQ